MGQPIEVRQRAQSKKKSLEAAVATSIGCPGEVCSGEESKVDRAMSQQTSKKEDEALEASEVEFKRSEFLQEIAFKHPNFGSPPVSQAFFLVFYLSSMSYELDFYRVM